MGTSNRKIADQTLKSDDLDHVSAQFLISEINRLIGSNKIHELRLEYSGSGKLRIRLDCEHICGSQIFNQLPPLLFRSPWRDLLGAGVPIEPMRGPTRAFLIVHGLKSMDSSSENAITKFGNFYCARDFPAAPWEQNNLRKLVCSRTEEVTKALKESKLLVRSDRDFRSLFAKLPAEILDKIVQKVALPNDNRLRELWLPRLSVDKPHIGLLLPLRAVNKQFYEYADRHMHRMGFPIKQMNRLENGLLTRKLENRRFQYAPCESTIETDEVYSRLLKLPTDESTPSTSQNT